MSLLALASSIPVLGFESVFPRKGCSWPWPRIFFVSFASSTVSSTPTLLCNADLGKIVCMGLVVVVGQKERAPIAVNRLAKFFFLPWFCRFITSHP